MNYTNMHTFKITSVIVVLLGLIIGFGLYSTHTLASSSKEMESKILDIEKSTKSGNWKEAAASLKSLKEDWKATSKTWTVLIDHFEIDNIDTTFSKIEKYIETKNTPLALAEVATARQYINHVPEMESLRLKNIF